MCGDGAGVGEADGIGGVWGVTEESIMRMSARLNFDYNASLNLAGTITHRNV